MKRELYASSWLGELISVSDVEPKCGEDFCDECGDCLACHAEDECMPRGGEHRWVVYDDDDE